MKGAGEMRKYYRRPLLAALCFGLLLFGPDPGVIHSGIVGGVAVQAAEGDTGSTAADGTVSDTPSQEAIADFASELDKDGDGEVDEPEAVADEPAAAEEEVDQDDEEGGSDDEDREDREDLTDDGLDNADDDSEDTAHTGKNRDDIDGDASPDFKLPGYVRYSAEAPLRRLGERGGLTPLIEREEQLLFGN